jgi:peptidoglycan/LPS O-acetylase OafA/YrhL
MKYQPSLDGFRAVAITSVILYHFWGGLFPGGWLGVDLFLVLSGFLITKTLTQELKSNGKIQFWKFYVRRSLRLSPAFACLILFELCYAMCSNNTLEILKAVGFSASYLMNWNRAFVWGPQAALGHTWSLAMEEQFYLVWPFFLLLITGRGSIAWVIGLMVVVLTWRIYLVVCGANPVRTYNGFDTHADVLLIGCLVALVPICDRRLDLIRSTAAVPIAIMAAFLLFLPLKNVVTQSVGFSATSICAAWLIIASMREGWVAKILSLRPLVYTGQISYGWYLWHYPLFFLLKPYFSHLNGIVVFVASYLIAITSFRFVETPCLRLNRRFEPVQHIAVQALDDQGSQHPPDGKTQSVTHNAG